jgi:hypothetical protein
MPGIMRSLVGTKSRLQFRRVMCQSLYSPKGMKGRDEDVACLSVV